MRLSERGFSQSQIADSTGTARLLDNPTVKFDQFPERQIPSSTQRPIAIYSDNVSPQTIALHVAHQYACDCLDSPLVLGINPCAN
jgi:hypothetical protein